MRLIAIIVSLLFMTTMGHAGGISGGGGGTVITDPAGTDAIAWMLRSARQTLLLEFKDSDFNHKDYPYSHPLFDGDDNILKKVKEYSLNVLTDKPCIDFDGNPNDGSINSLDHTICISAFTIGQKVTKETAFPQLLALMAHEYSHLMGFGEDDATKFQKEVLAQSVTVTDLSSEHFLTLFLRQGLDNVANLERAQKESSSKRLKAIYSVLKVIENQDQRYWNFPLRGIDYNESQTYFLVNLRLANLRYYLCSQVDPEKNIRKMCKEDYLNAFNGKSEITAIEFQDSFPADGRCNLQDEKIENLLKNPKSLDEEIKKILDLYEKLTNFTTDALKISN